MYLAHEWLQRLRPETRFKRCQSSRQNFGSNQETMLFSIGLLLALLALTDDDSIWFGVRKFKPIIQRGGVPKVEGRSGIRPLEGK